MLGEELAEEEVSERGFFGDRAYALVDPGSGEKNAKRAGWEGLFAFGAELVGERPRILSATYRYNENQAGVHAGVPRGGKVCRGDPATLV